MICMSNKNCHSVLLFPPEGGFLAEHLSAEAGFDSKLRAYEDLNGKLKKQYFKSLHCSSWQLKVKKVCGLEVDLSFKPV